MWPWGANRKNQSINLAGVVQDYLGSSGVILEKIVERSDAVTCVLRLGPGANPVDEGALRSILAPYVGDRAVHVLVTGERTSPPPSPQSAHRAPLGAVDVPGVKHIIAVASGKGGVGKSTVAVNLAVALSRAGLKTGLLDADIYGPSVPMMMGIKGQRVSPGDHKKLVPIVAHGVKCLSMGLLVDTDAPMIWRGPMVQSAIIQMLRDVDWAGETGLDVLVVDMPPGTGDAQLTFAQKVKLSGAIIVTTPQDVAMLDAQKGLQMFQKTGVNILGVVENMSVFCCPNCGSESAIFGAGAAQGLAVREGVPFLGALPIEAAVRERGDAGMPEPGEGYGEIVKKIVEQMG